MTNIYNKNVMNKFGQIKSNIESLMTKSYGKNSFKTNMKSFKNHVIVCGYGSFGKQILLNLKKNNIQHLGIIDNYEFLEIELYFFY